MRSFRYASGEGERAAVLFRTLTQVGQAAGPPVVADADPIVGDRHRELGRGCRDVDIDAARVGVPRGVGQRLAQDGDQIVDNRFGYDRVDRSAEADLRFKAENGRDLGGHGEQSGADGAAPAVGR